MPLRQYTFREFKIGYDNLLNAFIDILGSDIIIKTPIMESFKRTVQLYRKDPNSDEYLIEYSKLNLLFENLRIIKERNPQFFDYVKKTLRGITKRDEFFGIRFEVNIGKTLTEKKIKVHKTDHPLPDFQIEVDGMNTFIECTSSHLSQTENVDITTKLQYAYDVKSSKPYANNNTALFIDITNLYYQVVRKGQIIESDEILQIIKNIAKPQYFGNVTVFWYADIAGKTFQSNYRRLDFETITPVLKSCLDRCFPTGNIRATFGLTEYG